MTLNNEIFGFIHSGYATKIRDLTTKALSCRRPNPFLDSSKEIPGMLTEISRCVSEYAKVCAEHDVIHIADLFDHANAALNAFFEDSYNPDLGYHMAGDRCVCQYIGLDVTVQR